MAEIITNVLGCTAGVDIKMDTSDRVLQDALQRGELIAHCKKINKNVSFGVGGLFGVPISAVCQNTKCPFHTWPIDFEPKKS